MESTRVHVFQVGFPPSISCFPQFVYEYPPLLWLCRNPLSVSLSIPMVASWGSGIGLPPSDVH